MKKNITTRVVLDLQDDEFMELGAFAFGFFAATGSDASMKSPFGRLAAKIKSKIETKATPGQLQYLERVIDALKQAATANEVDVMMMTDGFSNLIDATERNIENEG